MHLARVASSLRGLLELRLEHRARARHHGPVFFAGTLPLQVEEEATVTVGMPKPLPGPCPFVSSDGSDRSGPLNKLSCAINNASIALISRRSPGSAFGDINDFPLICGP